MPPAQATRYIDANPVDVQLDIPMLGQFRMFFFVPDIHSAKTFLNAVCSHISSSESILGRATAAAAKSYAQLNLPSVEADHFIQPGRYTATSHLFTLATVTTMQKSTVEITDLPSSLQKSRWTFYMDDLKDQKTGKSCTEKWLGEVGRGEVALVNVRPDGYIGSVGRFDGTSDGAAASQWLDTYYGGFLKA
jgi:hypothetical protein